MAQIIIEVDDNELRGFLKDFLCYGSFKIGEKLNDFLDGDFEKLKSYPLENNELLRKSLGKFLKKYIDHQILNGDSWNMFDVEDYEIIEKELLADLEAKKLKKNKGLKKNKVKMCKL